MAIYFYKQYGELGYLANYSDHGYELEVKYWPTVEHYYQSKKFDDEELKRLNDEADRYFSLGIQEISKYITEDVLDTLNWYVYALKEANYHPYIFFDPNFTIDTGIICIWEEDMKYLNMLLI